MDQDLHAFDRFIARYISVNQRWNSPKFLIGESYGTTRSAGLSDLLGKDGIQLNGDCADFVDFELRDPFAGVRHHLHFEFAELRGGGVVLQQDSRTSRRM